MGVAQVGMITVELVSSAQPDSLKIVTQVIVE